jgi:membrane protease YdiL (CAAX protease family)
VRLFEGRPLKSLALADGRAMWHYLRGWLVGGVIFSAAVGLMALLGFVENTPQPQAVSLTLLGGSVALVLVGWVVQGAAEEFIFRGWLLPVLAVRLKPWLGILLSSIGFAFIHSLNPNLSPLAVVNLFLFGVFAALYTIYEGSIWGIFSIHTVWNWLQGNVFGFQVSGSSSVGGSLLNLRETGPDIITGGSFGPEGGLAVTLVLLVACAVVIFLSRRQGDANPILPAS